MNNKFCELYNLTENLAVEELIVLYKGRVAFQQYIPKKYRRFGIKIYKLCDSLGYTYDMSMYLGKQRQHAKAQITATHGMVLQLKIFMDYYFTSPSLFDDLFQRIMRVEAWNATRYWAKIPKNEKGGHSDMNKGNRKGCSLERQAGCVHSYKHARTPC